MTEFDTLSRHLQVSLHLPSGPLSLQTAVVFGARVNKPGLEYYQGDHSSSRCGSARSLQRSATPVAVKLSLSRRSTSAMAIAESNSESGDFDQNGMERMAGFRHTARLNDVDHAFGVVVRDYGLKFPGLGDLLVDHCSVRRSGSMSSHSLISVCAVCTDSTRSQKHKKCIEKRPSNSSTGDSLCTLGPKRIPR